MSVFIEAVADDAAEVAGPSRWTLIRRVIVFQIKLALDGFRDLVMSPLSIVAGIVGVLIGGREPDWAFRRLMRFGRETDRWIDLFDARDALDERHPERTVMRLFSPNLRASLNRAPRLPTTALVPPQLESHPPVSE